MNREERKDWFEFVRGREIRWVWDDGDKCRVVVPHRILPNTGGERWEVSKGFGLDKRYKGRWVLEEAPTTSFILED